VSRDPAQLSADLAQAQRRFSTGREVTTMTRPTRAHASPDELLDCLVDAEQDRWIRCGRHDHDRRSELLAAALAAGCTPDDIARALGVTATDVRAWTPA
jgi:hypothetical protein